jgi:Rieske Fe-S protein
MSEPREWSTGRHRETRRTMLKVVLGLGLGIPVADLAAGQDTDPKKARPQTNDQFVFAGGPRTGQPITLADLPLGGAPVTAYPMDPKIKVVRDDSRLNQVLLVRLSPDDLADDTRSRAAEGIVAYSAVCTHTGCDIWEWRAEDDPVPLSLLRVRSQGRRPGPHRAGSEAIAGAPAQDRRRRSGGGRRLCRSPGLRDRRGVISPGDVP